MVTAIKRKRGERNIKVIDLANEVGVSRWTMDAILKDSNHAVTPATNAKLVNWLARNS